ncbi:MAG TPA: hypothetical protein VHG08_01755 [Longimicrobium sp.]|nr:hypothetical protein [Longimicrobium sp.]
MKLSLFAVAAAACALASTPAQAQPEVVTDQLESAASMMAEDGFLPADEPVTGTLAQGDDEEFELDLQAGVSYFIVGVCDNDCSDLDLVLTDEGGDEVDSDRKLDDIPMLVLEAERTGSYVLSVQMATCDASRCHYGVRVFQQR